MKRGWGITQGCSAWGREGYGATWQQPPDTPKERFRRSEPGPLLQGVSGGWEAKGVAAHEVFQTGCKESPSQVLELGRTLWVKAPRDSPTGPHGRPRSELGLHQLWPETPANPNYSVVSSLLCQQGQMTDPYLPEDRVALGSSNAVLWKWARVLMELLENLPGLWGVGSSKESSVPEFGSQGFQSLVLQLSTLTVSFPSLRSVFNGCHHFPFKWHSSSKPAVKEHQQRSAVITRASQWLISSAVICQNTLM